MTTDDTIQATADDHLQAAGEIKRFKHSLKHLIALGDQIETLSGYQKLIAESQKRLSDLSEHESAWREHRDLEASLPALREEEQVLRDRVATLHRVADLETAEAAAAAALTKAQNASAAVQKRLTELQAKVDHAGVTLTELDEQVATKKRALTEIEAEVSKWRSRFTA